MKYLVTWGTRVELIEADDEVMARCLWVEQHRPEWWELWQPDYYGQRRPPRSVGFSLDPDHDLHVREATPEDIERLGEITERTLAVAGKRGWR